MTERVAARRSFMKTTSAVVLGVAAGGQSGALSEEPDKDPAVHHTFDVREFGAKGDGKNLDSPAINKAIAAAAGVGGGTVHFTAGTYLCYSIRLKSRVQLFLTSGATILAADPPKDGKMDLIWLSPTNHGRTTRISGTTTGTTALFGVKGWKMSPSAARV